MQTFVAENPSGVKVHTKILRGQAVERILAFAATEHMDLIVISASGKQHFLDNIIGSKSAQIANKAHCAVILVPQNAQWHNLDRILFASSYESMMPEMITKVIEFSKQFQAEVHLVNVNDTGSEKGKVIPEISWEQIFPVSKPNHVFEVHAIYGQDVIKALHQYAENHDIQLITFVSKHRGFWENLVHRSVSESVSLVTDKPIMIIHLDDTP